MVDQRTLYIEAGVGATVLTRTRFSNRNIGSAFQFGDHIGVGFLLTPNSRVGVRYSHFSNAGIKRPNPGLDTVQLTHASILMHGPHHRPGVAGAALAACRQAPV